MNKAEFLVQGSAKEPYRITIERSENNLHAFCTCKAGMSGQCCKHKFRLLSGNPQGVVGGDLLMLSTVVDWLVGTDVEHALTQLCHAEDRYELAKQSLSAAKKGLAVALRK